MPQLVFIHWKNYAVMMSSIRVVLSLAGNINLKIEQLDVKTTILHSLDRYTVVIQLDNVAGKINNG
jgi:hypothetical protein